jgi:hypothetical protein
MMSLIGNELWLLLGLGGTTNGSDRFSSGSSSSQKSGHQKSGHQKSGSQMNSYQMSSRATISWQQRPWTAAILAILNMSLSYHKALVMMETFLLTIRPDLRLHPYL